MRHVIALALGALFLPLLGLAGIGQAQAQSAALQVDGTIDAVDCQAQTVDLSAPSGTNTIAAADMTVVLINSMSVPFCNLQDYVGAPVTAWLMPAGDQFVATQIDVTGQPAAQPAPAPAEVDSPVPIVGAVLGTVVVAGLIYLLVHGPDGDYYRYPYYGAYYRYYYHPQYHPYIGYYPVSAPVIFVAPVIVGVVLGVVVVDRLQYLLTRDAGGHMYRYPYWGPYHQVYYHPTYRSYAGAYQTVPVRQGDPHWNGPGSRSIQAPATHNVPQRQPVTVPQRTAPQFQYTPLNRPAPQQQPVTAPQRTTPQVQRTPTTPPAPQRQPVTAPQRTTPQVQYTPTTRPAPQRQPVTTPQRTTPQVQYTPTTRPAPQRQPVTAPQRTTPQVQYTPLTRPAPQRQPNVTQQSGGRSNTRGSGNSNSQCDRSRNQSCGNGGQSK